MELSQIKVKADGDKCNKYANMLSDDLDKCLKKISGVTKILKKMVQEPAESEGGLPKLISSMETLSGE
eukprot:3372539-Pyramimonas_sp.AAC.1